MKYLPLILIFLALTACSSNLGDSTNNNFPDPDDLEVPERSEPNYYFCEDTDEGVDILKKGTVTSDLGTFTDTCQGDYKLREYNCNDKTADSSERRCVQGPCVDGACTVVEKESACVDSDGGSFYKILGTATGVDGASKADYCADGMLYEAYCDYADIASYKSIKCDVCNAGVCVEEKVPVIIEGCVDSDGGVEYYVKGITTDENGGNKSDICLGEKLLEESYCDPYGLTNSKTYRCLCTDGACTGPA